MLSKAGVESDSFVVDVPEHRIINIDDLQALETQSDVLAVREISFLLKEVLSI